jgi:hypothetical protein
MSTPKAHDLDMVRRYQELDYVATFSKYWATFNHWFRGETGKDADRDAIELLKKNKRWIDAIEAARPVLDPLIDSVVHGEHAGAADYYRYGNGGEIARFIAALFACPRTHARVNSYGTTPKDRVRGTATIPLTALEYRLAYSHCQAALAEPSFMPEASHRMEEIFAFRRIAHVGSAFFRDTPAIPAPTGLTIAYFDRCWQLIDADNRCAELTELSRSAIAPGLASDLLELLYLVRNGCVHGTLDFLVPEDNRVAREAHHLLEVLLNRIRQ